MIEIWFIDGKVPSVAVACFEQQATMPIPLIGDAVKFTPAQGDSKVCFATVDHKQFLYDPNGRLERIEIRCVNVHCRPDQ